MLGAFDSALERQMAALGVVRRDMECEFFGVKKESRGYYIVLPDHGAFYLHKDGAVRNGVGSKSKEPAFWDTEEEAQEFFDSWKLTRT